MAQLAKTRGLLQRQFSCNVMSDLIGQTNLRKSTPAAYRKLRAIVRTFERFGALGNDIQLTEKEIEANNVIMCLKMEEYRKGILHPNQFVPGFHIFKKLEEIKQSPLFHLLKKMPKGGALKTHDSSMCSTDFLIELTYRKHLWVCCTEGGCKIVQFRFSKEKPTKSYYEEGKWETMEQLRDRRGEEDVLKDLRKSFSMFPLSEFESNIEAWSHLNGIFLLISGLLKYYPVWGEYFYNALEEFSDDGVQYVEVRSRLPRLYDLDGNKMPVQETVKSYQEHLECFKEEHPDFIDARLIYAPVRHVEPEKVAEHVCVCTELNKEFPNLVIGFDLVGQEEFSNPLSKFVEQLLKLPKHINFYFHAGQTNWNGSEVDENLIDAVLLGTKRIGNAFAITKHPLVMQLVKKLGIAIEVCPVCNQVLQLGADYRNHPAATLIANDIPFVLSSGNPSLWRTTPLSHDFYMAFLGIAPLNADLKFLKRISKHSIRYSALTDEEKSNAMQKWKIKWDEWIANMC